MWPLARLTVQLSCRRRAWFRSSCAGMVQSERLRLEALCTPVPAQSSAIQHLCIQSLGRKTT